MGHQFKIQANSTNMTLLQLLTCADLLIFFVLCGHIHMCFALDSFEYRLLSATLQHLVHFKLPKESHSSAEHYIQSYLLRFSGFNILTSAPLSFALCAPHSSRSLTNSRHHSGLARCPMGVQSATSATTTRTCTLT